MRCFTRDLQIQVKVSKFTSKKSEETDLDLLECLWKGTVGRGTASLPTESKTPHSLQQSGSKIPEGHRSNAY